MNKIVKASALPGGRLLVEMQDGRCGEFDMTPFMESDFFAPLKDETYFAQVRPFFAGVGWPGGQDLGPDTIAASLETSAFAACRT